MSAPSTAQRLLDAQVTWIVERLTSDDLPDLVSQTVDDLLAAGKGIPLGTLVEADAVKQLLRLVLERVPSGAAASTMVGIVADTVYDGPSQSFTLNDVIDRDHVETLLTEMFALADVAEVFLDQIAESPLVATVAARFVGRIVGDVLATNRAVAEKIPGVGSLMSLGTSMAGKVVGAADKQFEALLGDTAGKGATFAMRRLNKVVVETLRDPAAREAALQVFDMYADQSIGDGPRPGSREDAHRVAGLFQDMAIAGVVSDPALALVDALVDGFFAVYREHPTSTLVDDLGLTRDDLVAQAQALAPRLISGAVASGEVERLVRIQLEPFFHSPAVAAILGD